MYSLLKVQHAVLPWRSLNSRFSLDLTKQKETSFCSIKVQNCLPIFEGKSSAYYLQYFRRYEILHHRYLKPFLNKLKSKE